VQKRVALKLEKIWMLGVIVELALGPGEGVLVGEVVEEKLAYVGPRVAVFVAWVADCE
jgi:hypothetical protein